MKNFSIVDKEYAGFNEYDQFSRSVSKLSVQLHHFTIGEQQITNHNCKIINFNSGIL